MKCVVIDSGSSSMKCGFSGELLPSFVVPSMIGRPKNPGIFVGMDSKECFFGNEAKRKRGILKIKYPIEYGRVWNWGDCEKIWEFLMTEKLKISEEEMKLYPILMTEAPFNPKNNRSTCMELFFNTFNVPSFYLCSTSALTLFFYGKVSGTVIDSGSSSTNIVPIENGYPKNPYSILSLKIGGRDLDSYFYRLFSESGGFEMTGCASSRININLMKEKVCYVSQDFESELRIQNVLFKKRKYLLPDGNNSVFLEIGKESFRCPEAIFNPSLLGISQPGIIDMINISINNNEEKKKYMYYSNIVIGGGNSLFSGFSERIKKDLVSSSSLLLQKHKVEVFAKENREFAAWIGGSVLSNLSSFKNNFLITKEEYEEYGYRIMEQKCSSTEGKLRKIRTSMLDLNYNIIQKDILERISFLIILIMNNTKEKEKEENMLKISIILNNSIIFNFPKIFII